MLVHQAGGDKLGRHTKQEYWIGYDSKSNGSLIYFSDIGAIKTEHNFLFVNNSHSGLKREKILTGKFQSSLKPAESPSEILKVPNSISFIPAPLPNTVPNPIIINEKSNNAIHDCKTNNLPEASVASVGRPKCTLNPSLKAVRGHLCHKLHLAISPSILHRFSRSQWLWKALEKTFRLVLVTSRGDQ